MWSSWFPNGVFPTKRSRNSNLQQRILSLFDSTSKSDQSATKKGSPMLKELQSQKNNVSRISSVYEENIAAFNNTENNSSKFAANLSVMLCRQPRVEQPNSIAPPEPNETSLKDWSEVKLSIKYWLEIETKYMKVMELLIENYVNACDNIPALHLKGEINVTNRQKEELFGPIVRTYELHRNVIHPKLAVCVNNLQLFGKTISAFCNDGTFNSYIVYAMDEKTCEHRRRVYYKFFMEELERKCNVSFQFAPTQHLAALHLILIEMLREVKNLKAPDDVIDSLFKAEADWKILMNKIYTMRNL